MNQNWANYTRFVGELIVLVAIGLGLGTGLHYLISDPEPPLQREAIQAVDPSPERSAPTDGPSNPEPSMAPQILADTPQPGSHTIPDLQTSQPIPMPKTSGPHPANLTGKVVSTEILVAKPSRPEPRADLRILPSDIATVPAPQPAEDPADVSDEEPRYEESGDRIISGKVLTGTGEAVPDLEITATVNRLFEKDAPSPPGLPNSQVRTDQDGIFEFEGLHDGEYTLHAVPPSPFQPVSMRVRAGMEEVTLVVGEARIQQVRGLVKRADSGVSIAGVIVEAGKHTTATDESGQYQFAVSLPGSGQGPTLLRFRHPEFQEQQATVPRVPQKTDIPITMKDVALELVQGRASVSGFVESQNDGTPLANMGVFLAPTNGHGQQDTVTAQDGTFQFPSVPWGTYTLVVVPKTGYQDLTHPDLKVTSAGVEDLHLQLSTLPTITLSGHFVDPAGQPVRGLTLFLTSRTVRTFTGKPVTSDSSGYFTLEDVPAGEVEFTTRSAPHLTISGLTLKTESTDPVTLPVDWGLQILTGQVVTAGGIPLPGAEISLSWSQTKDGLTSRAIRHSTADATGTFRFTQLGPGRHTLNVSATGYTRTLVEHVVSPEHPTVQVILAPRAS